MAELSLTCPAPTEQQSNNSNVSILRRVLVRAGHHLAANSSIDVNNPGSGWISSGDLISVSGSNDFVENTQVYRGGQLLLTGANASDNNDVYFVSANSIIAFEHPIVTNDIIQIWQFVTASG